MSTLFDRAVRRDRLRNCAIEDLPRPALIAALRQGPKAARPAEFAQLRKAQLVVAVRRGLAAPATCAAVAEALRYARETG